MISGLEGRRVLVVGGGGFLGLHVVAALQKAKAVVSAIDMFKPMIPSDTIDWHIGNVQDETFVASLVSEQDAVIYLASHSLPATANADMAAEIVDHVRATVKTAEICDKMGAKRFIFASSGGTVYGSSTRGAIPEDAPTFPINAYGVSKLACEHYLRVLGELRSIATIALRIANPYGEGQRTGRGQGFVAAVFDKILTGDRLEIWGDGSVVRDFIYVGDVAQAFVRACAYDGSPAAINIGSGTGHTLIDIVRAVEATVGRRLDVTFLQGRAIDAAHNVLDIGKARRLLGWVPATPLDVGLLRTWRSHGAP